eukprot:1461418-Prymnesium_polylepis.1
MQRGSLHLCTASGEAPRRRCVCAAHAAGVAAEAVQRLCIGCAEAVPRAARPCRGADPLCTSSASVRPR